MGNNTCVHENDSVFMIKTYQFMQRNKEIPYSTKTNESFKTLYINRKLHYNRHIVWVRIFVSVCIS